MLTLVYRELKYILILPVTLTLSLTRILAILHKKLTKIAKRPRISDRKHAAHTRKFRLRLIGYRAANAVFNT